MSSPYSGNGSGGNVALCTRGAGLTIYAISVQKDANERMYVYGESSKTFLSE